MWQVNQRVSAVLDELENVSQPGVSTASVAEQAFKLLGRLGIGPAFLGYGRPPFPSVVCISVNDVVVHGVPRADVVLQRGDVVSIDFGAERGGYYGDSARTFMVGARERTEADSDAASDRLLAATRGALEVAIELCHEGSDVRDLSAAIEEHLGRYGCAAVRAFSGHGIGTRMHEDPLVPNFVARRAKKVPLRVGMVLAIEPMATLGRHEIVIDNDGWTARTKDGTLAAHFEHSVAITPEGPWVLSARESRAPGAWDAADDVPAAYI